MKIYDIIVIGGGPAGLSAALVASRLNKHILIFDDKRYRNEKAKKLSALYGDKIFHCPYCDFAPYLVITKWHGDSYIRYEFEII